MSAEGQGGFLHWVPGGMCGAAVQSRGAWQLCLLQRLFCGCGTRANVCEFMTLLAARESLARSILSRVLFIGTQLFVSSALASTTSNPLIFKLMLWYPGNQNVELLSYLCALLCLQLHTAYHEDKKEIMWWSDHRGQYFRCKTIMMSWLCTLP